MLETFFLGGGLFYAVLRSFMVVSNLSVLGKIPLALLEFLVWSCSSYIFWGDDPAVAKIACPFDLHVGNWGKTKMIAVHCLQQELSCCQERCFPLCQGKTYSRKHGDNGKETMEISKKGVIYGSGKNMKSPLGGRRPVQFRIDQDKLWTTGCVLWLF